MTQASIEKVITSIFITYDGVIVICVVRAEYRWENNNMCASLFPVIK